MVSATPAGWVILAALLAFPPLVQGATPRLPAAAVALGLLAVFLAWVARWRREPLQSLRLTAIDGLLALLLFLAVYSTLTAPYYFAAEQVLVPLVCFLLGYWGLAARPSFRGWRLAAAAVRVQAAGQAALVLGQAAAGALRPAGTFFNPNFLAGFLAVALLLGVGARIFPSREARPPLAASLAEGALLLAALFVTGSRGGALAFVAGLAVLLAARSLRALVAAAAVAVAALAFVPNPLVERIRGFDTVDPFAWTRVSIWQSALAMARDRPFTGIGVGQYENVSPRYAFPVETHWAKYTRRAENAHNDYLQTAVELGLPGLAVLLAIAGIAAVAVGRELRRAPPERRASLAPLAAGLTAIAAQAAVDFPLRTPPAGLLLLLLGVGLRMQGVTGPGFPVEVRLRARHAVLAAALALAVAGAAVRPVAGFWFFLRAIGAPQNLLREKWALTEAPRRQVPPEEAVRALELATRVDWPCASYHRALGSVLFQGALRAGGDHRQVERALYELNLAVELSPENHTYHANLGEAATSLARRSADPRPRLEEALRHYRRAAELAPWSFVLYEHIGALADELGDAAAAERAFRRAVAIEEYHLRGWLNLGSFLARHGRLAEARAAFERGAGLAERARTLVPTNEAERALVAVPPAAFYNELEKLDRLMPVANPS